MRKPDEKAARQAEPVADGPMINGKNQNDYPAAERPCFAHGCPLLGTITDTVVHSRAAMWLCRFHSGQPASRWDQITTDVRKAERA